MRNYKPTKGDIRWRDASNAKTNPFQEARLLQSVSHEYLSVMLHDNSGPTSTGFKSMLDAEVSRRGSALARRANLIAMASAALSAISIVIALLS
ncbi:hypothetical protein HNP52_002269 [Sphingomonas kyeonggiensis]|uniref:Uncharacterized protein n=1 Tax=Sphingomonas kyeonggiensis TaxID=1268553 RepID=A0A7W7K2L1_9SPHN|nr:hypothetical protein [Sphingomonas kyeonggiensis]MBB4839200.1 hypothetical protein [Sphingomonas kyeonggiensis]